MRTEKCCFAIDETMLLHLKGKGVNSSSKALCKEAEVKSINTDIYEIEYKEKTVLGVFLFG